LKTSQITCVVNCGLSAVTYSDTLQTMKHSYKMRYNMLHITNVFSLADITDIISFLCTS